MFLIKNKIILDLNLDSIHIVNILCVKSVPIRLLRKMWVCRIRGLALPGLRQRSDQHGGRNGYCHFLPQLTSISFLGLLFLYYSSQFSQKTQVMDLSRLVKLMLSQDFKILMRSMTTLKASLGIINYGIIIND